MKSCTGLLLVLFAISGTAAYGWGKTGHDAIAYMAECNLTPKAKKRIERYLNGRSIVYYASWMDQVRTTEAYGATTHWHGNRVDAEGRYLPDEVRGDAVYGIELAKSKLLDLRHGDDSVVRVAICLLVHLVGDMHCPSHIRYPWYESFKFEINGRKCSFHGFWDTEVLEMNHRWGYEDYRYQLDRCPKQEMEALAAGSPRDWLADSARQCREISDWVAADDRLDKARANEFLMKAQQLAETQLLKAGYRLARILNELFG